MSLQAEPQTGESFTILIVDDDASSRLLLKAQLKPFGYRILEAVDGAGAVETFDHHHPDLVLMDIVMPGMDGYEASTRIRELAGSTYVPILFVTSAIDESAIARSVDAGGDDFLSKPITPVVLDARIRAALRRRVLYQQLQEQHHALQQQQIHEEREQELAKEIFGRIAHLGCLDDAGIPYIASSLMVFNGDMLLAARTPYGALRVMLGDFTGHGLPAAVGSLPSAETFYGMTAKGFNISEVAAEINTKLNRILPKGIFCAAALIELNSETRQLSIWNGGLPNLILLQNQPGEIVRRFDSVHLALGILAPGDFDASIETETMTPDHYLIAYTDGITETENPQGELYGDHRLLECIRSHGDARGTFDKIIQELDDFREHAAQMDDYTLIEIPCDIQNQAGNADDYCIQPPKTAGSWDYELRFDGDTLGNVDPVPMLLQTIIHIQGLECFREPLFTVLTELYVNALDHGVLKLDSTLKHSTEGFAEFFSQRDKRLENLGGAFICIRFKHTAHKDGGRLTIQIQDSGEGFDEDEVCNDASGAPAPCGRGIMLVRNLCTSLSYSDGGRTAEAVYDWQA